MARKLKNYHIQFQKIEYVHTPRNNNNTVLKIGTFVVIRPPDSFHESEPAISIGDTL